MWDAENRLTEVKQGPTTLASFTYDGWAQRQQKVAAGVTHTYVLDGSSIIEERVSTGHTLRYVEGPAIDQHLAMQDGATITYYVADHLGSVMQETSSAGAVTLARKYDPWGNMLAGASSGGWAFTGREWDPETGLSYYRSRYFNPELGRFLSEDPLGLGGGVNLYGYVGGSPVVFVDPSGRVKVVPQGQTATYRGVPWINDQGKFWPQPHTVQITYTCTKTPGDCWQLEFTVTYDYLKIYPTCCPNVKREEDQHQADWEAKVTQWASPATRVEGTYPTEQACRQAGEDGKGRTTSSPVPRPDSGNEHGPVDRFWEGLKRVFMRPR